MIMSGMMADGISISTHPGDIAYMRANVPCQWACPARTNVPRYIEAIYRGDYGRSNILNAETNLFPGVMGRICSRPCERACRHGDPDLGEPLAICYLKRVAADCSGHDYPVAGQRFARTGKTVGVVGGGPAGLAAAHTLAVFGHRVTIYEALPKLGGMLMYGIPTFRLPRQVVEDDILNVLQLGIQVECRRKMGTDFTAADLLVRHDAVILAAGTFAPRRLELPGIGLPGVFSGLDFMMRVNEGRPPHVGRTALVIGGGFTAHDCARAALRLGAEDACICLRLTEEHLTVTREESLETKREGVRYLNLVASAAILGTDRVEALRFQRTRLAGVNARGERTAEPIADSDFTFAADCVVLAIGQGPESAMAAAGLPQEPRFDRESGASDIPGLYAAGDFVRGASTVVEAIGHAQRVAAEVDRRLMGRARRTLAVTVEPAADTRRERGWDFLPRCAMPNLETTERMVSMTAEVRTGLTPGQGSTESQRCYLCDLKYEIDIPRCISCRWCIEVCPRQCIGLAESGAFPAPDTEDGAPAAAGIRWTSRWDRAAGVVIDNARCVRCGLCLRVCPTRCIGVVQTSLAGKVVLTGDDR